MHNGSINAGNPSQHELNNIPSILQPGPNQTGTKPLMIAASRPSRKTPSNSFDSAATYSEILQQLKQIALAKRLKT
jgi:hypothetical protein